jgi:hypothetical protein
MRGKDTQQSATFSYLWVPAERPLRPIRTMVDAALKGLSRSFGRRAPPECQILFETCFGLFSAAFISPQPHAPTNFQLLTADSEQAIRATNTRECSSRDLMPVLLNALNI